MRTTPVARKPQLVSLYAHQTLMFAGCLATVGVILVACCSTRRVSDGRTSEEQRRIAEACLNMLRSSLTNETDIRLEDPRVPQIIRSLQPVEIQIQGTDVVIMRVGKPAEYHLSRRPSDPKPWVLYVAGQGYDGHQELIRLEHD